MEAVKALHLVLVTWHPSAISAGLTCVMIY